MVQQKTVFSELIRDDGGKYRWVYEQPMLKSYFLLFEVWKVLGISAIIVYVTFCAVELISGRGTEISLAVTKTFLLVLGILITLSAPAYLIVTWANGGKYTVLFEMDDSGIDHIQIKTERARALEALTVFVGRKAQNRTTSAAGLLSAGGVSLYSRFERVKSIKLRRDRNTIFLNGLFFRNQIYVSEEYIDFVYGYIAERCPQARILKQR